MPLRDLIGKEVRVCYAREPAHVVGELPNWARIEDVDLPLIKVSGTYPPARWINAALIVEIREYEVTT